MEQYLKSEHNIKLHELCRPYDRGNEMESFSTCADSINVTLLTFGVHISHDSPPTPAPPPQKKKKKKKNQKTKNILLQLKTNCYSYVSKLKAVRRHRYEGTVLKSSRIAGETEFLAHTSPIEKH